MNFIFHKNASLHFRTLLIRCVLEEFYQFDIITFGLVLWIHLNCWIVLLNYILWKSVQEVSCTVTWPTLRNACLPFLTHSNSMTGTAFAFNSPLYGGAHLLLTSPYALIYFKLESDISQSDCLCPHPLRFCLLRVIALERFIRSVHNARYAEKSANCHFWRGVCFDSLLFMHRI